MKFVRFLSKPLNRHHTSTTKPTALFAAIGLLASIAWAVNPIVVKEQEFSDSKTGDRFMIIGVDYQPGGQAAYGTGSGDPFSDPTTCLRDAALMQNLGVNTIRSYNVDPTLDHDECVSIFNSVGIYLIVDVNSPLAGQSIDRAAPASSYNKGYLEHIFSVVEAFKNYPNVLGFFAGNEIINTVGTGQSNPPFIRAVQRDLKNYISQHAPRQIPVGYSAADVRQVLQDTWAYLQCEINGTTDPSRSDFFGLNSYSWCGNASSYTISGYDQLVAMFGDVSTVTADLLLQHHLVTTSLTSTTSIDNHPRLLLRIRLQQPTTALLRRSPHHLWPPNDRALRRPRLRMDARDIRLRPHPTLLQQHRSGPQRLRHSNVQIQRPQHQTPRNLQLHSNSPPTTPVLLQPHQQRQLQHQLHNPRHTTRRRPAHLFRNLQTTFRLSRLCHANESPSRRLRHQRRPARGPRDPHWR